VPVPMKFSSFSKLVPRCFADAARVALSVLLAFTLFISPALASPDGALLFENNCAGCHVNGGNIVRRGKNLKLKTLQKNGVDSVEAIAQLVTQGKGLMSAYGDRLTAEEIAIVSQYVLERSQQDWKKD
jgi:cytochrome c6